MTNLFMDSTAAGDYATKYSTSSGTWTVGTSSPRVSGGSYISSGNSGALNKRSFTAASEVYAGVGFFDVAQGYLSFYGDAGATQHISVLLNGSGNIEVRRGSSAGTLLATGATTVAGGTWCQIEARVTISDTVGVVQVRLNGSTSNEVNFSGDTKNAGTNTTIDAVAVVRTLTCKYTDFYINDTNGSVNNTWEGDVKAVYLIPTGNGTTSQLTGSDGNSVNNYQQVDETPTSGSDYNGDSTVGHGDTYAMTDLGAGVTSIKALQWVGFIAKSDAGAIAAKRRIRSGSTDYTGSSLTLSTSYQTFLEILETDPATSAAWTASGVNALEAGMEVA